MSLVGLFEVCFYNSKYILNYIKFYDKKISAYLPNVRFSANFHYKYSQN